MRIKTKLNKDLDLRRFGKNEYSKNSGNGGNNSNKSTLFTILDTPIKFAEVTSRPVGSGGAKAAPAVQYEEVLTALYSLDEFVAAYNNNLLTKSRDVSYFPIYDKEVSRINLQCLLYEDYYDEFEPLYEFMDSGTFIYQELCEGYIFSKLGAEVILIDGRE